MKSRTKKRIAAVATGISALAGVAYALSREASQPEREASGPMFRSDAPFFSEGMDLAIPVPTKIKMTKRPATKYQTGMESQYKPKGRSVPLLFPNDPKFIGNRRWSGYNKVLAAPVVGTRTYTNKRISTKSASVELANPYVKNMIRTGDWGMNDFFNAGGQRVSGYKTKRSFVAIK